MTRELKVTLSTGAVLAVGILTVGAVVAHERLGGWAGASYQARLWYIGHVPPLFWPSEPFTPEAWRRAPLETRYRFAKSLVASGRLRGLSPDEVGTLLGATIPADSGRWLTPLRRVGFQNLWWVLILEFDEGRVKSARRDIAWLDR